MNALQKIAFVTQAKALSLVRPLLGNRRFTKLYTRVLDSAGVDITSFDVCGFIAPSVEFDKYAFERIHVGKNVYLTHDVILLVHDQSAVTAWNAAGGGIDTGTLHQPRDIWIGDNVFIGMRTIVMPGARIGDNVVIGAGSLVKGEIPSGTVWAGNPARRISTIDEYRTKLRERGVFDSLIHANDGKELHG